ncbi:hypothetical protein CCR75_003198 [Bremia lactucae]|uniref:EF-hand domain-containing protein n=1 Tax=Bremia lactucae TaxID=4779 RepID=A0A976FM54_BRELC|nr:hypothetical protein CCR75_003198 [Bremia lactucae]
MTDSYDDLLLLNDSLSTESKVDDSPSSSSETSAHNPPPSDAAFLRQSARQSASTSFQLVDWASDNGIRRHNVSSDCMANSSHLNKISEDSQNQISCDFPVPEFKNPHRSTNNTYGKATAPMPTTLYDKNVLQILTIGSIDPISKESNSEDWSESLGPVDEIEDMTLMDPHYDLTSAKMMKLFSLFHPGENGMVSYDGFRCGLEAMGIACGNDKQFQTFIQNIDDDQSGGITYHEFLFAIQEIKLAQLFNDNFLRKMLPEYTQKNGNKTNKNARLGSIEYSPDHIRSVYPIEQVQRFIYSTKPGWATMRWINVEGIDPLLMRRLSVRYRLHPLAIEDTLDADVERPKYEEYDEHTSLILQTIHARDFALVKKYQSMYRASLYVHDHDVSPFDTMTKQEILERLNQLHIGSVMTKPQQLSLYIMEDVLISVQENSSQPLWSILKQRLDRSYSKVRQHGTAFLVYTIVDVCVDELAPITHTFGAKLMMLERLLKLEPRSFDINVVGSSSKQIKGLQVLCKPLSEVIIQLSESEAFESETLRYFRDVLDHITTIEEDCDRHLDRCRSLIEDFHNMRAAQQNEVSYILALVAAIFLPAQFLTGLYGMNFTNMPELRSQSGYFVWWVVVLMIAFATIAFFKFYKKWL